MTFPGRMVRISCSLAVCAFALLLFAQDDRGKAELQTKGGKMLVDYGRPELKGRDPLTWQKEGSYWRMGKNDMTTLTTSENLRCGAVTVPKGSYGLWLLKSSPDRYELVFNSETSGMGMMHDKSKDVASVLLGKEAVPKSLEKFTIDLKSTAAGAHLALSWATTRLSCDCEFVK